MAEPAESWGEAALWLGHAQDRDASALLLSFFLVGVTGESGGEPATCIARAAFTIMFVTLVPSNHTCYDFFKNGSRFSSSAPLR